MIRDTPQDVAQRLVSFQLGGETLLDGLEERMEGIATLATIGLTDDRVETLQTVQGCAATVLALLMARRERRRLQAIGNG